MLIVRQNMSKIKLLKKSCDAYTQYKAGHYYVQSKNWSVYF